MAPIDRKIFIESGIFNLFFKFKLNFFEHCGIQVKIIDFVENVSPSDSISLFSCCKNNLIFEKGVEM